MGASTRFTKKNFLKTMITQTIPYQHYERGLPQSGNWIIGQEIDKSIIVYQAFNKPIAEWAVKHQRFGGNAYSFSRMTWIKPNFLWMMYRAGWATKANQERILAIKMSKSGFIELLEEGVYSSFKPDKYETREAWKAALDESEVRIQWDPDHDPHGEKLERRAIQIGIKGSMLDKFNTEFVEGIENITEFVHEQKANLDKDAATLFVMNESIIKVPQSLKDKYSIPES